MGADMVDQSDGAAQILVEHQVFAEYPDRHDLLLLQMIASGDRLPIAPHELAAWRARPDTGEHLIFGDTEHDESPVVFSTQQSCSELTGSFAAAGQILWLHAGASISHPVTGAGYGRAITR